MGLTLMRWIKRMTNMTLILEVLETTLQAARSFPKHLSCSQYIISHLRKHSCLTIPSCPGVSFLHRREMCMVIQPERNLYQRQLNAARSCHEPVGLDVFFVGIRRRNISGQTLHCLHHGFLSIDGGGSHQFLRDGDEIRHSLYTFSIARAY